MPHLSLVDLLDELEVAAAVAVAGVQEQEAPLLVVMPILAAMASPLRHLAGDGVSDRWDGRSQQTANLAGHCAFAAAAWQGMPATHVSDLVGAAGDVISRQSGTELGRDARWAIVLRLGDLSRTVVDAIAETPYARLHMLIDIRASAVEVARRGAVDPPDPGLLRALSRPVLPARVDSTSRVLSSPSDAVRHLVYELNAAGELVAPIVLEAACRAVSQLVRDVPAYQPASAAFWDAADLLTGMIAPDLRSETSRRVYNAAASLQQAGRPSVPADELATLTPHLVELAEVIGQHVHRLPGRALVPRGDTPYSERRIPEFLSRPPRTFMVNWPDLRPVADVLSRAADSLAAVAETIPGQAPGLAPLGDMRLGPPAPGAGLGPAPSL